MKIKIDKFSGIIPRRSDRLLPDVNAMIADNLAVDSGRLVGFTTVPERGSDSDITLPDIFSIPSAPSVSVGTNRLFDNITITCKAWVFRLEDGEIAYTWNATLTQKSLVYTDTGIRVVFTMPAYPSTLVWPLNSDDEPLENKFIGGQYQLSFTGLGSIPSAEPSTMGAGMFGTEEIQLLDSDDDRYGTLKIKSVENGDFVQTKIMKPPTNTSQMYYYDTLGQRDVTFDIDLGYNTQLPKYASYIVSHVDSEGREGPPSEPSTVIERDPTKPVVVGVEMPSGGGVARIYRAASGLKASDFYFLADVSSGSYTDKKTDAMLGEALPDLYGNCPSELSDLKKMPGDFYVGWYGNTIYFSEPGMDYVWPEEYQISIDADLTIKKIEVIGNAVYVLTDGYPYVLTGSHPQVVAVNKVSYNLPCSASSSVVAIDEVLFYASSEGLVRMAGTQAKVVTYDFFSKQGWEALTPDDMEISTSGDNLFITVNGTSGTEDESLGVVCGTLMFHLNNYSPDCLTTITEGALTWKSKIFQLERPVSWTCARVVASNYNSVTLNLYAKTNVMSDDSELSLVHNQIVQSDVAFRIPALYPSKVWILEIVANDAIIEALEVATNMREMRS